MQTIARMGVVSKNDSKEAFGHQNQPLFPVFLFLANLPLHYLASSRFSILLTQNCLGLQYDSHLIN
jgi:hypothetical protein